MYLDITYIYISRKIKMICNLRWRSVALCNLQLSPSEKLNNFKLSKKILAFISPNKFSIKIYYIINIIILIL